MRAISHSPRFLGCGQILITEKVVNHANINHGRPRMRIAINTKYKSVPEGLEFDLPEFCILTGKNGSGKSHLLEAIANRSISTITANNQAIHNVLLVGYNGLNPQVDERCESAQLTQMTNHWWNSIHGVIIHYKQHMLGKQFFDNIVDDYVIPHHGNDPVRTAIIRKVLKKSGKNLEELTEEDIYKNVSYAENNNGTLFFSQCAMIFKGYHVRWTKNKFNKFLISEGDAKGLTFLSDQEFINKHGPAPWDLINEILAKANLPYEFINPNVGDVDLPYNLKLVDRSTGVDISVNDLSSGEKVLMSLALAIYNTHEGGTKPEVLLLDEPDAPLHPEFSKLLIDTLVDTLVGRANVKVVMTTHSPATVAMAPNNSVYEVQRDTKLPVMVSNSRAVENLTKGIGFLRVSYESRRQVFVESKYDVLYFEKIFDALNRMHCYEYQPIFMEPHSGSSNCTDVINIVQRLRDAGNDLVVGIVDYDGTNEPAKSLLVLGHERRYAIENYILDPLYIVLALVRYGKATYAEFGLHNRHTYPEARDFTEAECQTLVDNLTARIGLGGGELDSAQLENGYTLNIPKTLLMHQGHAYETLLQQIFPTLQAISKGQGDSALKLRVVEVIAEFPQFLPKEIGVIFSSLSNFNT